MQLTHTQQIQAQEKEEAEEKNTHFASRRTADTYKNKIK